MYDVDGNGWIDLPEMTRIVKSIYNMMGPNQVNLLHLFKAIMYFHLEMSYTPFIFCPNDPNTNPWPNIGIIDANVALRHILGTQVLRKTKGKSNDSKGK